MAEQRSFVYAVTFIVIFSVILSTIPSDFQGVDETPDMVTPVEPSLITGFTESQTYTYANFTYYPLGDFAVYEYVLNSKEWAISQNDYLFTLGTKAKFGGVLWFGQYDYVNFIAPDGSNREQWLDFDDIEADAEDGIVRYDLQYVGYGSSGGQLVVYWNTTTYETAVLAWNDEALYFIHGVGIQDTALQDIGSLLISLMLLQLPDVPLLINILLIIPIWASILYLLWFLIVNMIPFLGGG